LKESLVDDLSFGADGLLPAAITEHKTGRLLVLCFVNREALQATAREGLVHLYRRSKGLVQKKGVDSGLVQMVR
jgi:phosphoribosyl-AMP cyclohydrolase